MPLNVARFTASFTQSRIWCVFHLAHTPDITFLDSVFEDNFIVAVQNLNGTIRRNLESLYRANRILQLSVPSDQRFE